MNNRGTFVIISSFILTLLCIYKGKNEEYIILVYTLKALIALSCFCQIVENYRL